MTNTLAAKLLKELDSVLEEARRVKNLRTGTVLDRVELVKLNPATTGGPTGKEVGAPEEQIILGPEQILDALDGYLLLLEAWQESHRDFLSGISAGSIEIPDELRQSIKSGLDSLKSTHEELMSHANTLQGDVGLELAEVNKKALVIKRYVDTLPSRVSITRKKEG